MRFALLGPLTVTDRFGARVVLPGPRRRVLLAAPLVRANVPVSADAPADEVWDGSPPPGAADTLRSHMSRLRRLLGPEAGAWIAAHPPGYLIRVSAAELDVLEFEDRCREAGAALRGGSWSDASDATARYGAVAGRAVAGRPQPQLARRGRAPPRAPAAPGLGPGRCHRGRAAGSSCAVGPRVPPSSTRVRPRG
ncbi:MAG TPA: hypothetical protein VFU73_01725 [Actinocrinis sp.]|nr:hypothetical protein [Actinocrinis sp.]